MSARNLLLNDFLALNKLGNYNVEHLPFDASYRRYIRLSNDIYSLVLQDSPPEHYSLQPSINITQYLLQSGLSVPKIYQYDMNNGFMLMEDFGNIHYKQVIENTNSKEKLVMIFQRLVDIIIKFQSLSLPSFQLKKQDPALLIEQASIYFAKYQNPDSAPSLQYDSEFRTIMHNVFKQLEYSPSYFIHRDFHVENLMYLQDRYEYASVGIIDFQDALVGSPIYDLVSLLQDVRTNISDETEQNMTDYYLQRNQTIDKSNFYAVYATLGLLRNMRIQAIFELKIHQDKQTKYLPYLPKVKYYIRLNLQHPVLKILKDYMLDLNKDYF